MKKFILLFAVAAALLCACKSETPTECNIPKNTVEFAGNAFTSFSLGADVKLYAYQNPQNSAEWAVQAVVPVRKEVNTPFEDLAIELIPLDDRGVRIRDGLVLQGEDLPNLIPVFNASDNVERTIVFSVMDEGKRYMSASEASQLLDNTKGVRMNFNATAPAPQQPVAEEQQPAVEQVAVEQPQAAPKAAPQAAPKAPSGPKEYPMTLDGLCRKHGIYGLLDQYDRYLRNDNGKAAKRIEDQLWAIEKRIKKDESIPKWLREKFVDYIEDKEDEIEDRY